MEFKVLLIQALAELLLNCESDLDCPEINLTVRQSFQIALPNVKRMVFDKIINVMSLLRNMRVYLKK